MKALFFFAFFTLESFTLNKELFEIQLIKRKWERIKITNCNDKAIYHEFGITYFTFNDKEFTIFSKENKTQEMNKGTWDYIKESQILDCQIENQQQLYKLIQLTDETLIIQHIDFNSGDRIQEEFKAGK